MAVDWDATLVDSDDNFLPGALDALRQLSSVANIIIHSCRGNYYEGAVWITGRLSAEGIPAEVWTAPGKPLADVYIDDRAVRFTNWEETLNVIRDQDILGAHRPRRHERRVEDYQGD